MTSIHNVDHIVLCLTNYGELYPYHLELARADASEGKWLAHVLTRALPQYRREMRTTAEIPMSTSVAVAAALREYYKKHLKEF